VFERFVRDARGTGRRPHGPRPSSRAPSGRVVVEVRAAGPDEAGAVLALWSDARGGHAMTPDTHETISRLLERSPDALLVADGPDGVVGVVIAGWDGWRGNLYRLAVHRDHRRHGIGRALVRAAEARLRAKGAPRISALVGHDDEAATAFWTAAGYDPDPVMGRFVRSV